ncbi:MAG TPA: flagellar biosynthetic protein FliO [Oribacterium sp.]|jgi:flagellar biosynthetic protein FliO|nr:flagellar biosynthetic protein FliO [Oribacterium sp.]
MHDMISMVSGILVLILILILAYMSSRFLGKSWNRTGHGNYMQIIDQLVVGPDRQLLIVKIKEQTYLMSSSSAGIQLIKELDGEFTIPESIGTLGNETFLQYLNRYRKQFGDRKDSSK